MSRGLDLPGAATPCNSVLRRCRSEMRFINWPSAHSIFVCILQAFESEHIERTISELVFQHATRVSEYFKKKMTWPQEVNCKEKQKRGSKPQMLT